MRVFKVIVSSRDYSVTSASQGIHKGLYAWPIYGPFSVTLLRAHPRVLRDIEAGGGGGACTVSKSITNFISIIF